MTELNHELASRWLRLCGVLLDSLISVAFIFPAMWFFGVWQKSMQSELLSVDLIGLFVAGQLLWLVLNGYLLAEYGQTIGKRIVGTRIVSADDGQIFPLSRIFWLRQLPFSLVALIPIIGSLLVLLDSLFIFRKDKRCIHDLIAGTKVVKADKQSSTVAEPVVTVNKPTGAAGNMQMPKLPNKEKSPAMNEETFYEQVGKEIAANDLQTGLWTRAFAEADGDENRAKAIYIKLRVAQLAESNRLQQAESSRLRLEEAKRTAIQEASDSNAVSSKAMSERWIQNIYANGDVTMGDKVTGKMWLHNVSLCGKMSWADAVAYCNDLTYAGYSDWRLPNKDELLAQFSQKGCFVDVQRNYYWADGNACFEWAYVVNMGNGSVYNRGKANDGYVWPVRGGQ